MKAVIFDLDGVITDTAELHYQAWKNLADSLKIHFDYKLNEELKGIGRMDSLNRILNFGGKTDQYTEIEKIALTEQKNTEYVALLDQLSPKSIYPGIKEFLDTLRNQNLKIGLASASKNGPKILELLEITDYFDTIVDPVSVKMGKPAPDIFLKAAEQLEVHSSKCIGIEDSEAGIHSIKTAGMFAIGVGTEKVMKAAGADLVICDTKNLHWDQIINTVNHQYS
ncbi:beta-phosphoglucomutase [Oceanobacillus jeddahense]|uniref:Beta-phosphoglucomutase n=1 Tax=Oceanobacillus jeddahense TaxID=1462527 RepID=A0ABY5JYS4_9BACI|nr:beta-phosphoglucomutase [Oceanobacillus jeddahense]UUI05583.1 beta-phosphoglucomutase [Oceanobacillus jeddahense]